jgi:hypothetical protein
MNLSGFSGQAGNETIRLPTKRHRISLRNISGQALLAQGFNQTAPVFVVVVKLRIVKSQQ